MKKMPKTFVTYENPKSAVEEAIKRVSTDTFREIALI